MGNGAEKLGTAFRQWGTTAKIMGAIAGRGMDHLGKMFPG